MSGLKKVLRFGRQLSAMTSSDEVCKQRQAAFKAIEWLVGLFVVAAQM